ncbi:MAG: glutaredoxin 3 [Myxococcota bacterium]
MKPVTVYTTTYCGFCRRAKSFLQERNIPFHEVDVTDDAAAREMLVQRTGQRTVPQIFFGEESVGGYSDLKALADAGNLDARLGRM